MSQVWPAPPPVEEQGIEAAPASSATIITGVYYSNVSVNFPAGRFSQTPVITLAASAGPGEVATAGFAAPPTAAGFAARVICFGAPVKATATLHWRATAR